MNDENQTTEKPTSSSDGTAQPAAVKKMSYAHAAGAFYTNPATRKMALITTGVAVVALGFGAYRMLSGPPAPQKLHNQIQAAHLHGAPGGSKGNKAYNAQLNQANHQMGQQAANAGKTYLPTPTALHPVAATKSVTAPAMSPAPVTAPVVVQNPYTPVAVTTSQQSALSQAMATELKRFVNDKPYGPVTVTQISKIKKVQPVGNAAAEQVLQGQSTMLALAGHISFAMLDIGVNSNDKSPIEATIEGGRFHGARLLGGFKREHQVVVMQFNIMTFNGQSYSIKAYAISAKNAHVGMATSVNNHVLYRYGWLFGAAFLQGIDQALQQANQAMVVGNGFAVMTHQLNNGQILQQAAGNIGNVMVPIAQNRFNTPPTVRVPARTGLGILFMAPVKENAHG
jgi:intracellular multiplication protein IcmE